MLGHNSDSAEHLRQYIEKIERLTEEKDNVTEDIKQVFAEAKATGFDNKAMRQVIKLRKLRPEEVEEQEHLLDTYRHALGMLPGEKV